VLDVRIPEVGIERVEDLRAALPTLGDQLRRDGLTFSRLPPYPNWSEFSHRAKPFVKVFLALTSPPYVERLGLRYINHFRLPYPTDMSEYFIGLPVVPKALPQFTSNMLARVTIHDPDRDFSAHVTQGLLDDLDPEKMGFILDIDVFRTAEFPPVAGHVGNSGGPESVQESGLLRTHNGAQRRGPRVMQILRRPETAQGRLGF
jgi:hypothetical protein